MAVDNVEKFIGKKVVLTLNLKEPNADGQTAEEHEGTVEAAHGGMAMFKYKGKTSATLLELADIEAIDYAPERAKKLARKTLKVVEFGQARNHLLERHGYTLTQVNGLTEQEADDQHLAIDHEASDLGHVHGDKPKPQAAAASDEESAA